MWYSWGPQSLVYPKATKKRGHCFQSTCKSPQTPQLMTWRQGPGRRLESEISPAEVRSGWGKGGQQERPDWRVFVCVCERGVRQRVRERDTGVEGVSGLSPTSMTRCLAVGCRECQCFQKRSCSTGPFSLSKTTITTLCKHSGHRDPLPQERPGQPHPFLVPGSGSPALWPGCPPLRGNGQSSKAPSPWRPWQAGLT